MGLADLRWTPEELRTLAGELEAETQRIAANALRQVADKIDNEIARNGFNQPLADLMQAARASNPELLSEDDLWRRIAGHVRDHIDNEKFYSVNDVPADRFFWAEDVGSNLVYRFNTDKGGRLEGRHWNGPEQARKWEPVARWAVEAGGPFRLVPSAMVKGIK
ncbi:hypothetical protein [Nocardia gipuzkoensis]